MFQPMIVLRHYEYSQSKFALFGPLRCFIAHVRQRGKHNLPEGNLYASTGILFPRGGSTLTFKIPR